jgi:hypothetical protein
MMFTGALGQASIFGGGRCEDSSSGGEPIAQDLCRRLARTIGSDLRRFSKVGQIERSQAAGLGDRRLNHGGNSPP